jgi:hypothetical protein
MELTLQITFRSGSSATYVAGLPEMGRWEEDFDRSVTELDKKPFRAVDLIYLAYCSMKRESTGKVLPWELWRDTVTGIENMGTKVPKVTASEVSEEPS